MHERNNTMAANLTVFAISFLTDGSEEFIQ